MANKRLTPISRKLRANPTDAEKRLWAHLRGRQLGVQFTRQFGIGGLVVDFACRRLKLAVEWTAVSIPTVRPTRTGRG